MMRNRVRVESRELGGERTVETSDGRTLRPDLTTETTVPLKVLARPSKLKARRDRRTNPSWRRRRVVVRPGELGSERTGGQKRHKRLGRGLQCHGLA